MRPAEVVEILGVGTGRLFTTLEGHNPTGSIKDRLVEAELEMLEARHGDLSRGIAEVSAGSTARSLAYYCQRRGVPFVAFIDARNLELGRELEAMGARVRTLAASTMQEAYEAYHRECVEHGWLPFQQFEDPGKRERYRSFGEALRAALPPIQHVIGAVGTGHSLLGTALAFERAVVHTAEPETSPVPGTRNLDRVWFGERDPLYPDRARLDRVMVSEPELWSSAPVSTNRGMLAVGESFRLVLGAVRKLDDGQAWLLVGADNRLLGSI